MNSLKMYYFLQSKVQNARLLKWIDFINIFFTQWCQIIVKKVILVFLCSRHSLKRDTYVFQGQVVFGRWANPI